MRILHVIAAMDLGGAEGVVAALARAAAAAGGTVAVAAAGGRTLERLDVEHFPVRLVERRPTRVLGAGRDLAVAVRRFRPQVCHVHNPGMALPAAIATRRGRRVPGVVTVHGLPDGDYRAAARVLRLSGLPVVSCGPGVDEALREAGLRSRAVITNGVARPESPGEPIASVLGLPERARVVTCVGRLAPVKNQQLAVRALARLPDDTHLVLVGDGPEHASLIRLSSDLGLADRVHLTGAREDAAALAAASDVVVSASRSEGMPLALAEAMAAGRPVVATRVRGSRDLVDDGRSGLLVAPDDVAALADGVRRLLDDSALAARLGAAAGQAVASLTEEAMVQAYLRLYAELVR